MGAIMLLNTTALGIGCWLISGTVGARVALGIFCIAWALLPWPPNRFDLRRKEKQASAERVRP